MRPLNKDEGVYVKSLGIHGTVTRVRPGDVDQPEEERTYEIRFQRYVARTDIQTAEDFPKPEKPAPELGKRCLAAC
jgi:hypothetical protein